MFISLIVRARMLSRLHLLQEKEKSSGFAYLSSLAGLGCERNERVCQGVQQICCCPWHKPRGNRGSIRSSCCSGLAFPSLFHASTSHVQKLGGILLRWTRQSLAQAWDTLVAYVDRRRRKHAADEHFRLITLRAFLNAWREVAWLLPRIQAAVNLWTNGCLTGE